MHASNEFMAKSGLLKFTEKSGLHMHRRTREFLEQASGTRLVLALGLCVTQHYKKKRIRQKLDGLIGKRQAQLSSQYHFLFLQRYKRFLMTPDRFELEAAESIVF